MRILRVHNRYQQRGGEDVSFESEVDMLRDRDEDVETLVFSNEEFARQPKGVNTLQLAAGTIWSQSSRKIIADALIRHDPAVVHFDNTFPLVSPAAYSVARQQGPAIVQSLRNYRLLCPSANFFRDGHVCEDCLGKTPPYPGVLHSCYRDSLPQTAVVASMLTAHRLRRTWTRDVDHYIPLTHFAKSKFIEGGFPPDRLSVKPNFVDIPTMPRQDDRTGMLYVGRLTEEKGVPSLVEAWSSLPDIHLTVIGDGPLQEDVMAGSARNSAISCLGRRTEVEVYSMMASASAVIVPSVWYEPFGRVAVEAFAHATPVIASKSGGLAELVEDGVTGLLFTPDDAGELAAKVRWAAEHLQEMRRMGENARREYEAKYTPERNYETLMDIYEQAIAHRRREP